jgi:hypothetical protein
MYHLLYEDKFHPPLVSRELDPWLDWHQDLGLVEVI